MLAIHSQRFPQLHRRKWLNAIQRDDVSSLAQICSLHFCATDFRRTKARVILSRGAIPTQHLPQSDGRHHHQTAIFRNCCRFCLEPNNAEGIRINWAAWPHSEYSKIYENITHLKVVFFLFFFWQIITLNFNTHTVSSVGKLFGILLHPMHWSFARNAEIDTFISKCIPFLAESYRFSRWEIESCSGCVRW